MNIDIQKTITETIAIETPAYFKDPNCPFFYKITEGAIIVAAPKMVYIIDGGALDKQASKIITYDSCISEQFYKAFYEAIKNISLFQK